MNDRASPEHSRRYHYGRKQGHRLREGQKALLESYLTTIGIDLAADGQIIAAALFDFPPERVILEIGFGSGENLAAHAAANPETGFIGCEPFINGVASFLRRLDTAKLKNVRLHADDARDLLEKLSDKSLDQIDILFPDPWPKTRHNKRRFINESVLAEFSRLLGDGGIVHFASDSGDYVRWTLRQFLAHPDFEWQADSQSDWTRPTDTEPTRYEQKALKAGRRSYDLRFIRAPRLVD